MERATSREELELRQQIIAVSNQLDPFVQMIGRMTPVEEREYLRLVREERRLRNQLRQLNRPTFRERVSSFLTTRRVRPVRVHGEAEIQEAPVARLSQIAPMEIQEDIPVARFME